MLQVWAILPSLVQKRRFYLMSTKSMLHQAMLNEWAARFSDQKASGLTIVEWCQQNNVSEHQFYYWKRQLKDEVVSQALPDIVPLAMPSVSPITTTTEVTRKTCASCTSCTTFPSNSCAKITLNGVSIEIDSSAPESFIKSLIKAVRHA